MSRPRWSALALAAALAAGAELSVPHSSDGRDGDVSGMTPLVRVFLGLPHRSLIEVSLAGQFAYAGLDSGLQIIDLSVGAPLSVLPLPGPAYDVAITGNILVVADGDAGLWLVDVANRAAPVAIGLLPMLGARAVAVSGTTAYVAVASPPPALSQGLRVVDLSVPSAPVELGFIALANGAQDVQVAGSHAYVALGADLTRPFALAVVDVSTPASPTLVGSLPTSLPVHEIALVGDTAHLATGVPAAGELVLANVSVPSSPVLVSRLPLADGVLGITVDAGVAFLAARSLGLVTVSLANPAAPVRIGALSTGRESVSVSELFGFALLGERSSIGAAALSGVNVSDPALPVAAGGLSYSEATDAAAEPGLAFLLRRQGLVILDISTPAAPTFVGSLLPAGADHSALDVDGNLAAISEGTTVHLVDVTDPAAPAIVGAVDVSDGIALKPVLSATRLYVVTGRGLEVFDVATPSAPLAIGSFATPGLSAALAVSGSTGFLVAGDTLYALDLAPQSPAVMGTLRIAGEELHGVAVDLAQDLAIATGRLRRFHVIDVANVASPLSIGSGPAGAGYGAALVGDRAVVAEGEDGVRVYDLSIPATPLLEASQDTSGTLYSLAVDQDTLLLATMASQHWITRCDSCPLSTCTPTSPILDLNSLRLAELGPNYDYRWIVLSGCCESNIATTTDKTRLPDLWMDAPVGSSATASFSDTVPPPPAGQVGYYQAFGRDSCTGASVQP